MSESEEPDEAFPYLPPTPEIRRQYQLIFDLEGPLPKRSLKRGFDICIASVALVAATPLLFLIKIAYLIEGFVIKENAGKIFFYYHAVSAGRVIPKYKIRIIKEGFIDRALADEHDWRAFSGEWTPESRTITGSVVKKFYLDELPQFWSVLKGDMSIVGPRPIAVIHYERDKAQGNVSRSLLTGGMLGLGHINKGTSEMGNPVYEYEYIEHYLKDSAWSLLLLDLWIIWKGIVLMSKGGGH